MTTSKDNKINILHGSINDVVYSPSDFSVVDVPSEKEHAEMLAKRLYNTTATKHVSLLLTRGRRDERLDCISNVGCFKNWSFLDSVNILYEKASSCSNSGLLPLSEPGYVVYKGSIPNIKATSWFQDDKKPNSTNFWDLSVSSEESSVNTYYKKCSWELLLLMYSLAMTSIYRSFIYALPVDCDEIISIGKFCHFMNLTVQIPIKDNKKAASLLEYYDNFKSNEK